MLPVALFVLRRQIVREKQYLGNLASLYGLAVHSEDVLGFFLPIAGKVKEIISIFEELTKEINRMER